MSAAAPLWQRALEARHAETRQRTKAIISETNRGAASRLALVAILRKVGEDVTLFEVHTWSRRTQGIAYLWAIDRLAGIENVPAPWRT